VSKSVDARLQRTYFVNALFKFTLSKYYKLLAYQKGGCAICGRKPTKIRLAVDHCHQTGLLRGLLCFRCNRAYGLFHDNDVNRLYRAAKYLESPPFVELYGKRHTAKGRLGTKVREKELKKMRNE